MSFWRPIHRGLAVLALGLALQVTGCDSPPEEQAAAPSATASPPAAAVAPPAAEAEAPVPLPEEPVSFDPGRDGRLSLREFYRQKYPAAEREAVGRAARQVLAGYDQAALEEAVAEILAYHHVVYHRTRLHDLEKNHEVARRVEGTLRDVARRFDVPFLPLMAIVSWENSGDLDKVSWADAAGVGQMTWGAVERAHTFAEQEAERLRPLADLARSLGQESRARDLDRRIEALDLAGRHKKLTHQANSNDERSVAQCNVEDAAMFLKYLLAMYGGRTDLAISAYHNGVLNNDDILYDYLVRQGEDLSYPEGDRTEFVATLRRRNVTYLDLWRDSRSRQMLNGLRTVEGERTTPGNSHMALGDESDIYPWKVLGSLAGYLAGPEWTARTVARYSDRWDLVEVRGLPRHDSRKAFAEAEQAGHLVRAEIPLLDLGLADGASPGLRPWSYHATPEMVGYLANLADRLREAAGNPRLRLPLATLSSASTLETGRTACPRGVSDNHLRGVAADLVPGRLDPGHARILDSLLWSDYLMDRIYLSRHGGTTHVVLNPRRGDEFMASYRKRFPASTAGDPEPR